MVSMSSLTTLYILTDFERAIQNMALDNAQVSESIILTHPSALHRLEKFI